MCPGNESGVKMDSDPLITQTGRVGDVDECDNGNEDTSSGYKHRVLPAFLHRLPLSELQVTEDLRSLAKIVCPVTAMTLLLHSKSVISMLFLGHLGNSELAGGSLAISFANITGFSVIKGLSMGMEPICCQAYGAKKLTVITQTFQRTLCLLLITAVLISLLWLNVEPILVLLKQDGDVIDVAKLYLRFSIPELIAQVHLHPLRSFMRTQCITKPLAIATMICLSLHLGINFILVIYMKLGVKGVALASAFNTINLDFCILIYLVWFKVSLKPWDGLTILSPFQGWKTLLCLALPSVFAVCLEWWWYEIMLLLCGLFQNPKASVAAMGILIQTTGLLYVFPHALSMGLSTRIGHELGAGHPNQARRLALIGLVSALTLGITAFGFTIVVRSVWAKMYTSEPDVLGLVSMALPVLGFCEIGNCPQTAACGVLTGSARTKVGAKINLIAFYVVGLPVAVVMAFVIKAGFIGLWFGLAAAQGACMCMMIYTLVKTDWKHQAKRSEELTRVSDNDLETGLLS